MKTRANHTMSTSRRVNLAGVTLTRGTFGQCEGVAGLVQRDQQQTCSETAAMAALCPAQHHGHLRLFVAGRRCATQFFEDSGITKFSAMQSAN